MNWDLVLISAGLTGAAINTGAFFAFSNFVMQALGTLSPTAGVEAMQAINRKAPNPIFVATILLAGPIGLPVLLGELNTLRAAASSYLLVGIVFSVLQFLLTMGGNVPMNNKLDRMDAATDAARSYWASYLTVWTRWNSLRGVASLVSALAYGLALRGR